MKIGVMGIEPLRVYGLKYLLTRIDCSVEIAVEDASAANRVLDHYEAFIMSPEVFISRPDYFMPRRDRILIMSNMHSTTVDTGGQIIFSDEPVDVIEHTLSKFLLARADADMHGALSSRETEVLRELARGKSHKEIADTLCISTNTVITHRKNITQKLGIRSVSGLSLYAMLNGII